MTATTVANVKCRIGEGVLYHPDETAVYWVDIPTGELYRYTPSTDEYEICRSGGPIGGFTFQEDGSVLLFGSEGQVTVWEDGESETVIDGILDEPGMRFNDVVADPAGRVFAGTMTDDDHTVGRLYRLDRDGTIVELESNVELPNGMGFAPDLETFYLVETNTNTIYAYDYDVESGDITNRSIFSRPDAEWGYDGLTVDSDGGVWVGLWGGGAVVRLTPAGELDASITIPAENVTTLSFGGDEYQTAYVTSATYEAPLTDERAGHLFAVETEYVGRPEYYSRVRV